MGKQPLRLLLLIALPMISTVILMSVFRDTLPHWTGPAYATLIPVAAAWLSVFKAPEHWDVLPAMAKWALGFVIALLIPAFIIVKWLPVNIGDSDREHLGKGDPTLDMTGFKKFGQQFDSLYKQDIREGAVKPHPLLICDYWFPAAHIDYYAARPAQLNLMAIGPMAAIHHYAWLNRERISLQPGTDAYFITVSNYFRPPGSSLRSQFKTVDQPLTVTQYRGGTAVRNFFIYRLKGYTGNLPSNGVMDQ